MSIEPAKRVTAVALQIHSNEAAAAHFAGFIVLPDAILGLTPRLYAGVRSADSQNRTLR